MLESAKRNMDAQKAWSIDEASRFQAVVALQDEIASSTADLPTLLTLIATRAQQLTGANGVTIEMREQDSLVCRAATGSAAPLLGLRTGRDGSLSWLAFTTGEVLTCDDARTDPRVDPALCESVNLRSMLAVPLRSGRTKFGVLIITSLRPGVFGDEHEQIMRLMAGILTSRLELDEQIQACQLLMSENAIAIATLREVEGRFHSAFEHSGIGMALTASNGRWLKVNPALCRILGYSRQELLARDQQSITHSDDRELEAPFVRQILAGEITTYELEKRYMRKDGSVVWGLLTISSVKSTGQQPLYFIAKLQDITAPKKAEEALRRLADHDDLTGLYNRREMLRLLKEETSRADRHRRAVSLIMLDIDAFKKVNDTYGHQAGDSALQQIARIVEESVRSFDRVARYGGEEFAVILPETTAADALVVAERMRTRIAAQEYSIGLENGADVRIPLTISAGIATITLNHEAAVEQLIREADAGLYEAKNGGRNRCVAAASASAPADAQPRQGAGHVG